MKIDPSVSRDRTPPVDLTGALRRSGLGQFLCGLGLGWCVLTFAFPGEARGQEIVTWEEALSRRVRPAYRYTYPGELQLCGWLESSVPARLNTAAPNGVIGRTWSPGLNQSRWEPISAPDAPASLAVNIVDLTCGVGSRSVLVESDGYYLELDGSLLASVDRNGALSEGILFSADDPSGQSPLMLREVCDARGCREALTDARQYASELTAAATARAAAEQARLAESQRRAEAQTLEILRSGASVGAQSSAILERRLVELYQDYGASEAQARAIIAGRVLVGMTPTMVRAALGTPSEVRSADGGDRLTDRWIYPRGAVLIREGRVVSTTIP